MVWKPRKTACKASQSVGSRSSVRTWDSIWTRCSRLSTIKSDISSGSQASDLACGALSRAGASRAFCRLATPSCNTLETVSGSAVEHSGQGSQRQRRRMPRPRPPIRHAHGLPQPRSSPAQAPRRMRSGWFSGSPTTSWRAMSSICCRNAPDGFTVRPFRSCSRYRPAERHRDSVTMPSPPPVPASSDGPACAGSAPAQ